MADPPSRPLDFCEEIVPPHDCTCLIDSKLDPGLTREANVAELAIVLVSRNQSWNVDRLIQSALRGADEVACCQILLVDSGSSDDTLPRASRYPVTQIRLRADGWLTPAAGRYNGTKLSLSDYILFLDGDMELRDGWVGAAMPLFADASVAVVTGEIADRPLTAKNNDSRATGSVNVGVDEIRYCGGAALYRRAALEIAGTFNPYLLGDEEAELCLRIRHAGYRVLRTRRVMASHYTEPSHVTIAGAMSRHRRGFNMGYGQNIRYLFGTRLLWIYLYDRGFALVPAAAVISLAAALAHAIASGRWLPLNLLCGLLIGSLATDAIRKKSVYRTGVSALARLLVLYGTIKGMLLPLKPKDEFPLSTDIFKAGLIRHSQKRCQ